MDKYFKKYISKLYFKRWLIGIGKCNIVDIIRSKNFDIKIKWLINKSFDRFFADPFPLNLNPDNLKILFEEYLFEEGYGKISLMTFDKNFKVISKKIILETKSHLSYPFIFNDNDKLYVFPEAAASGKLSCYEYDLNNEKLIFVKDILNIPLLDSTIIKYKNRYWIFAALGDYSSIYKLCIFHSDKLLGPYEPHNLNEKLQGLNGIRPAGNFIEVDGILYRPTQNCKNYYGESITIMKVTEFNESNYAEEFYLNICIDKHKKANKNKHTIHTINSFGKFVVVDGEHWSFSPIRQLKKILKR
jgi:hypothetical protein